MKRVLILSTYTIKDPVGGGQKRVAALVDQYRTAGHDVKHVAIYIDTTHTGVEQSDIAITLDDYKDNPLIYVIGDLLLADSLEKHDAAREKFLGLVREFSPDVVQVEQSFLYKTVRGALDSIQWDGVMVNSTHNIEAPLKQEILSSADNINLSEQEIQEIVSDIDVLERFAAQDADYTIACTLSDAEELERFGATDVILAPNGIERTALNRVEIAKVRLAFSKRGVNRVILYVGSGHPPNLTGFVELIGAKVGFLADDTRLVVAGGVANLIYDYIQKQPNYIRTIFLRKVDLVGMVTESRLSALLHVADQIILPIVEGGGSNLKTAEALLADKRIVATAKSFRSYEKYLELPNIIIADTPPEFRQAMSVSIDSKKVRRTHAEQKLADGVQWRNTLSDAVERLNS